MYRINAVDLYNLNSLLMKEEQFYIVERLVKS